MILKSVLQARADRGYRWLEAYGPRYDLDVSRLHQGAPLDVRSLHCCPLVLCYTGTEDLFSRYSRVLLRLEPIFGSREERGIFLSDHGFRIESGTWTRLLFDVGSARDWGTLTNAWLKVIAANRGLFPNLHE